MQEIGQFELKAREGEAESIFEDILRELHHAEAKFPTWPGDPVHGAAIVAEEAGELVKTALDWYYKRGKPHDVEIEAIHTAAMAVRFLLFMNRVIEAEETGPE